MKRLSKSRYTQFCKCQKNLWLNAYKPEVAVVDASTEARFESGNEVGDLAMGLFGSFVEVTTMQANRSLDLAAMVEDYLGPLWKLPRCKQIGVSILLPWWKRPHRR